MKRLEIPGGLYIDALPGGEYACIVPSKGIVTTYIGDFRQPQGFLPYYIRVTNKPSFKFAGQSTENNKTLEWNESWNTLNIIPCGVSPVIYDKDGKLLISDCSIGSQGYRYVDYATGRVATGDDTLYDPVSQLHEYTYIGEGIYIGQGSQSGCLVWDGHVHRLVEGGNCKVIRVERDGENLSIAMYHPNLPSVIIWLTIDELLNLPIYEPKRLILDRPAWLGAFIFGKENLPFPGNCKLKVEDPALVIANDGEILYRYVAEEMVGTLDSLNEAIKKASFEHPVLRPLPYWNYKLQSGPAPNANTVFVEAYWKVWESLAQFEDRLNQSVKKCGRAILAAQCYTSNNTNQQDLNPIVEVVTRVFNNNENVDGIIAFSAGEGRGTGWEVHQEVQMSWTQLGVGLVRPVTVPLPVPPIEPPKPVEAKVQIQTDVIYQNFFKDYTDVTEVPHPDGHMLVAYRLPNGKYFSLTPQGVRNTDADTPGAYERFNVFGNMAIHDLSKAVVPRFSGQIANLP